MNLSLNTKLPAHLAKSGIAPTVKHVSFRDDFQHEMSELLRSQQGFEEFAQDFRSGRWGSSLIPVSDRCQHLGFNELNLNLNHSFDTAEDENSTTTSGSYTVDDPSPRDITINYMPEQAVV